MPLPRCRILRPALASVAVGAALTALGAGPAAAAKPKGPVEVQLLGVNDFHGALEQRTLFGRPVGGAAFLDSHLDKAAAENPDRTIRVHAGDMVGATPFVSSYFHDEPSVKAMNLMDFDVGTVGNHEFDEGGEEMLRLIRGGQRNDGLETKDASGQPVNTSDPEYPGAEFPYIGANTRYASSDQRVLKPYRIESRGGVKVGFIGVTTEDTPNIVLPEFVKPFRFDDISESVNRWVPELKEKGVESIVVLAHSGALPKDNPAGEIVDETREMSSEVDVVVAGHTHSELNTRIPNQDGSGDKLVVEAFANGTAYDKVKMSVDPASGEVASKSAQIVTTFHSDPVGAPSIAPDPETNALVQEHKDKVAPIVNRVVGNAAADVNHDTGSRPVVDSPLGNLIADAQRTQAGADLAFMNPGGIRANIASGEVTFGELFSVQPFDNSLLKMEMKGDAVKALLEQQAFPNPGDSRARTGILQVSGFKYTYDATRPQGDRVTSVTVGDTALEASRTYTVAANEFIAFGGDGFTVLRDRASNKQRVSSDLEALVKHVGSLPQPFTAPAGGTRINRAG